MKKFFTISVIMAIILNLGGYGQSKSYPNPSAAYVEKMGYLFSVVRDADGNEQGNVIFPDGSKADAWAFLRGKAGQQYSYCTKKGYATESESINHGTWIEETSVCSKVDKNGRKTKIPMLELMEKNGEPLIEEMVRPENINPPEYKTNTNLKSTTTIPTAFDWRSYNGHTYIGPVRNQGSCGSCYSFGANASAEGVYNFATGNYDGNCVDFSESFIIWCLGHRCVYSTHFQGCVGADWTYYELQALVDSGVTYESNFPYQVTDPGVCTHWNNPRIRFHNWYRVGCSDIEGIKTAIMTYGVVDAAVYVTASFQGYTGGVFSNASTSCPSSTCYYTLTNHAVALVGWGVDPVEGEYWILRNSWGSNWGEGGYMRIKTTSARVACEVAYLTFATADVTPNITVEPNMLHGVTDFNIIIKVTELNMVSTNGLITVLVPKDSRMSFTYNPSATMIGSNPVSNSVWSYSSDAIYHKFTTTSVISAGSFSQLGFSALWSEESAVGTYSITSQITSYSGGETRIDNNVDAEKLDYFIY